LYQGTISVPSRIPEHSKCVSSCVTPILSNLDLQPAAAAEGASVKDPSTHMTSVWSFLSCTRVYPLSRCNYQDASRSDRSSAAFPRFSRIVTYLAREICFRLACLVPVSSLCKINTTHPYQAGVQGQQKTSASSLSFPNQIPSSMLAPLLLTFSIYSLIVEFCILSKLHRSRTYTRFLFRSTLSKQIRPICESRRELNRIEDIIPFQALLSLKIIPSFGMHSTLDLLLL
jgi:hypothetical protein